MKKIFGRNKKLSLCDLDPFYKETVAHLPPDVRVNYCNSLIMRCRYDIDAAKDVRTVSALNQLIAVTENEIKSLSG